MKRYKNKSEHGVKEDMPTACYVLFSVPGILQ